MNRILKVSSGLALPKGDRWPTFVTVSLVQSNARLHSIGVLLNEGDYDSAVILTRSLFELGVNLSYISKDIKKRLAKYLRHGGVLLTNEEVEQAKAQLERLESGRMDVKDIVPKGAWKHLKEMCCDLGSGRLKEYEIFYRYASVPTHTGAFTLGETLTRLLTGGSLPDREQTAVLVTASELHLRVVQIAAETFPQHIAIGTVEVLHKECSTLGGSLRQDQP